MKPRIIIEWSDEDRAYIARAPELGVVSHGGSYVHAAEMITEAIELHFMCLDDEEIELRDSAFLIAEYDQGMNLTTREHFVCAATLRGQSLEDAAKSMNVTRERIRQIKAKAVRKIKKQADEIT